MPALFAGGRGGLRCVGCGRPVLWFETEALPTLPVPNGGDFAVTPVPRTSWLFELAGSEGAGNNGLCLSTCPVPDVSAALFEQCEMHLVQIEEGLQTIRRLAKGTKWLEDFVDVVQPRIAWARTVLETARTAEEGVGSAQSERRLLRLDDELGKACSYIDATTAALRSIGARRRRRGRGSNGSD